MAYNDLYAVLKWTHTRLLAEYGSREVYYVLRLAMHPYRTIKDVPARLYERLAAEMRAL